MKLLITFLISITCVVNIYSQRICEYGEYDFVLNKIKGIEKTIFSKVKFLNNKEKEPFYIYKYDSLARLIEAKFSGDGKLFTDRVKSSCYGIYHSYYEYLDNKKPNKIRIKDNDITHDAIFVYDSNEYLKQITYNEFLTIDYKYNSKNQIESITKDRKVYKYFWNKNSQIEKIDIIFLKDKTQQEITFIYDNEKLKKVFHTQTRQGFQQINSLFTYKYKNNRICKITKVDKKKVKNASKKTLYFDFDYKNKEKLVINMRNSEKEYLNHYECYY